MALCIFMIHGGCVTDLETLGLPSRLIWPLKMLFTDTDMYDPLSRNEMEDFYSFLREYQLIDRLTIPSEHYDMVLDITRNEDNSIYWSYYYACHDTRCLFWLDRYDPTYISFERDGVESPAHLSASRHLQFAPYFH